MTGQVLSIMLDIAVLVALGFTIFFCFKLSRSMASFRQHRQDMGKLIDRLSKNIDEALRAIDGLKMAGDRSGRELQKIINDSKMMAEELQIINESANNIATRLEKLAENGSVAPQGAAIPRNIQATPARKPAITDRPAFFIHDRDYSDQSPTAGEEEDVPEHLQSQAEKELFAALRKKPSSRGAM
jgi:hypothetical protein